jgi:D-alanyl-D-alanine carboxypeptidase/D-alanyl-D-alanine-endopeptidase (penicillin-binding protein 4)
MKIKRFIVLILSFLIVEAAFSNALPPRKILKILKSSVILNDHFTGFSLFDLGKRKMITSLNEDKYFTPASNAKLVTFYAGTELRISLFRLYYVYSVGRGMSLLV